jgi:hypothetical protein
MNFLTLREYAGLEDSDCAAGTVVVISELDTALKVARGRLGFQNGPRPADSLKIVPQ